MTDKGKQTNGQRTFNSTKPTFCFSCIRLAFLCIKLVYLQNPFTSYINVRNQVNSLRQSYLPSEINTLLIANKPVLSFSQRLYLTWLCLLIASCKACSLPQNVNMLSNQYTNTKYLNHPFALSTSLHAEWQ